jgi:ABC-type transport system substrate-binding protein
MFFYAEYFFQFAGYFFVPSYNSRGRNHANSRTRSRRQPGYGYDRRGVEPHSQLTTDSASSEVSQHIFIALLRYSKDLKLVPWAAESYEVLEGGQKFRFVIRPGILWEDGVELNASDVGIHL